jgi:hypothetical protein
MPELALVLFFVVLGIFVATAVVALLGVTRRVTVDDKHLSWLLRATVGEVAAAVILLFTNTSFFGPDIESYVSSLPAEVQGETTESTRDSIIAMVGRYSLRGSYLVELEGDLSRAVGRADSLSEIAAEYDRIRGRSLTALARLKCDLGDLGDPTVNLTYPPSDAKSECVQRVKLVLAALNVLPDDTPETPEGIRNALASYQTSKGFSVDKCEGFFGEATWRAMLTDYVEQVRSDI